MVFPIPKLALTCLLNLPGKNNATGTIKMLKIVKIPKKKGFLSNRIEQFYPLKVYCYNSVKEKLQHS